MLLNSAQRAAVEHVNGPLLVLAGAGSGKTRVLTERVGRLLESGIAPDHVLAFTFTNRAAREMRERIERRVGREAARRLWVGTFHGTGLRLLRRESHRGEIAGRDPNFVVYDREDQESLLKEILKGMGLTEEAARPGEILGKISDAKSALVTPQEAMRVAMTPFQRRVSEAYAFYEEGLRRRSAFDFDDLIAQVVWLFRARPEVAEFYARRFVHVLVDEYQDTNHSQFRIVEALGKGHDNVFVVGDDDQMIFSWRGADLSNILDFERGFPGAAVIRLEQNYRSTGNILAAANAVIENNRERKGKRLWCEREGGARLRFVLAGDESEEAQRVVQFLHERALATGASRQLRECAVLYRTHAQSRALETELRHRGIPYELVGGISFYQRREVKDLLAYLRLAVNPTDAAAFWRALNTPKRGLGDAVRARIEARVKAGAPNPIEALRAALQEGGLGRGASSATAFLELLDELRARAAEPADVLLREVLERTAYLHWLEGEDERAAAERRANVEELLEAAAAFAATAAEPGLATYLAEAALLTDADRLEEGADRVLLLTAHNAKGLEFDTVVVAGLEEGLLPHASSLDIPSELEEERRLFYVALTRARHEVLLTAAAFRHRFTSGGYGAAGGQVSRFVDEIPVELLDREEPIRASRVEDDEYPAACRPRRAGHEPGERRKCNGGSPMNSWTSAGPTARSKAVGREVYHESFGRGVVMAAEGQGDTLRYTVRFGTRIKKVLARFLTENSHVE
ncbi:MAG: ATP-dependent DNA helicase PcrA [Candidatus Eisenbacteria bacterium]|uniref:DNA 3'-5' helicase n=1 Tax=Eiseniibacteriota bacterium TaxID=2212470 RepID=A0A538UBR3_UNCEI|nr:MAG: ATP-dependent DNA helicase PcrA [Candidatus Eisenbacteria bacterium]